MMLAGGLGACGPISASRACPLRAPFARVPFPTVLSNSASIPRPNCQGCQPRQVPEAHKHCKQAVRQRIHARIRKKVNGTPARPRLAVFRSNQYLTAQVIDDDARVTLVHVTTMQQSMKAELENASLKNSEAARAVARRVAELCKQQGIEKLVFDRGGFLYHGRVKLIADTIREEGILM